MSVGACQRSCISTFASPNVAVVNWSYLAGFIDGEGSICLSRGGSYRYKGVARVPTYRPLLAVSNNNRDVLRQILEFVGFGTLHVHPSRSPNARTGYVAYFSGLRIKSVLKNLVPHLIVKKRQAEVAIGFIERRESQRTRPFTDEDYAYVDTMRRLNDRVPTKGSPIQPLPAPRKRKPWRSIGKRV